MPLDVIELARFLAMAADTLEAKWFSARVMVTFSDPHESVPLRASTGVSVKRWKDHWLVMPTYQHLYVMTTEQVKVHLKSRRDADGNVESVSPKEVSVLEKGLEILLEKRTATPVPYEMVVTHKPSNKITERKFNAVSEEEAIQYVENRMRSSAESIDTGLTVELLCKGLKIKDFSVNFKRGGGHYTGD